MLGRISHKQSRALLFLDDGKKIIPAVTSQWEGLYYIMHEPEP
jgi:hypothetical protein